MYPLYLNRCTEKSKARKTPALLLMSFLILKFKNYLDICVPNPLGIGEEDTLILLLTIIFILL